MNVIWYDMISSKYGYSNKNDFEKSIPSANSLNELVKVEEIGNIPDNILMKHVDKLNEEVPQ